MRVNRLSVSIGGVIGCVFMLSCTGIVQNVQAQSLLDRLEQTVKRGIAAATEEAPAPEIAPPAKPSGGQPGYLGLVGDDTNEQGRGVRVLSVKQQGPADVAGLRAGDLITSIEGRGVGSLEDFAAALAKAQAGSRLRIQIQRGGQTQVIPVTLAARTKAPADAGAVPPPAVVPVDPLAAPPGGAPVPAPGDEPLPAPGGAAPLPGRPQARASLGVTVNEVSAELRAAHGIPVDRGAVIVAIRRGSAAEAAGLPVGAAIVAVGVRRVDSAADLVREIAGLPVGQDVEVAYYHRNRLVRRKVRLTAAPVEPSQPQIEPPAGRPGGLLRRGGSDRPLLRGLERALDSIVRPEAGPGFPAPGLPPAVGGTDSEQVQQLRAEVDALRRQLLELQQRLERLERQN